MRVVALLGGIFAATLLVGCAGTPSPAVPRLAADSGTGAGRDGPPAGLPMPVLPERLTPPEAGVGDLGALAEALVDSDAVRLELDPAARAAGIDASLERWLAVHGVATQRAFDRPIGEVLSLPLPVAMEDRGERRHFGVEGVRVLAPVAGARLVVGPVSVDLGAWRALPVRMAGGCELTLATLGAGQEMALASLEPALDGLEASLLEAWRRAVPATLDRARRSLGSARPGECREAGEAYLDEVQACARVDARCAVRPLLYLRSDLVIALAEPASTWTEDCARELGVDPRAMVAATAEEVVGSRLAELDPRWFELADRVAALSVLQDAIEDVCTPRRWHLPDDVRLRAGGRVRAGAAAFRRPGPALPGRWQAATGSHYVSGVGVTRTLARFEASEGGPAREIRSAAASLRPLVLDAATCVGAAESQPWAVALIDGDEVRYLGLFQLEELRCADVRR